jgi:hypothetical protein
MYQIAIVKDTEIANKGLFEAISVTFVNVET